MAAEQNYGNHARFFPLFHFFAFPILAIHFIVTVVWLVQAPSPRGVWTALVAAALAGAVLGSRLMALTVQDRLIRLEERLRLARVLPADHVRA